MFYVYERLSPYNNSAVSTVITHVHGGGDNQMSPDTTALTVYRHEPQPVFLPTSTVSSMMLLAQERHIK